MNPVSVTRAPTFRLSVIFSAASVVSGVLLFALIYWQTEVFESKRIAGFVASEAHVVAHVPPDQIQWTVQALVAGQYHAMPFAALFDSAGQLIVGNLRHIPVGLPVDGTVHKVEFNPDDGDGKPLTVIAVADRLADGKFLVLGRGEGVVTALAEIVAGALIPGTIPAIGPALMTGMWLSRQARRRVQAVNQSIERIMQGHVDERLPVRGGADDFDQLASSVNRMLAEIQRLLAEVQGVSDNIAHDLRTPLARVRSLLERGRERAQTKDELAAVADRAIAGLDQALSIVTALLRIGEIESGQRKAAFAELDLGDIVREAGELYGPIADEKQIRFDVQAAGALPVPGDKDLLIEAIANLLDNAIKFTPPGGEVCLSLENRSEGAVIRVSDTGPGIPPEERAAVMKRFYQIDKSRHAPGSGLGLSIVVAIARLHDFEVVISDAQPGCRFELLCYKATAQSEATRVPSATRPKAAFTPPPLCAGPAALARSINE